MLIDFTIETLPYEVPAVIADLRNKNFDNVLVPYKKQKLHTCALTRVGIILVSRFARATPRIEKKF